MVNYYKIIFAFIILLFGNDLLAEDRYLSWVEPKTQSRSKINLRTKELLFEKETIGWVIEGKIKLDTTILNNLPRQVKSDYFFFENGERIRFTIDGTGLVYDYYTEKQELVRADNTYHRGYNYFSSKFLRNGIIYSAGGVGFWNYSSSITYYDDQLKEWEILKPKNEIPIPIAGGYMGYNDKQDVFYVGGSRITKYLENLENDYSDELYLYDFNKNRWSHLGKLNPDLPYKKTEPIIWTGEVFLHIENGNLYLIDPQINEVWLYAANNKVMLSGFDQYVYQDTIKFFVEKNGGNAIKLSISELKRSSTYWGKFYTSGVPVSWYFSGVLAIILIFLLRWWIRKKTDKKGSIRFTNVENRLLRKLLELNNEKYLTAHDVNEILGTSNKSLDNQRKIRLKVISELNKKLKQEFNIENGIERHSLPEDKRLTAFQLNKQMREELIKIFR